MLHETLEYLGIAFVSSALLIIMSKIILQALIRRPADYYAAEELREEEIMLNSAGISITNEHETNPEGEPIEESHLEAHIDYFEPVEPEEIITEIPDAVHESIEITPDDEEPEEEAGDTEAVFEEPEEVIEIHETEDYIDLPEEPEQEPEMEEPAVEEPEAEESDVEEAAAEEPADFTFKIKAKTSRVKKPKRLEEEEKAEEEAAARAAMEAAQAAGADDRVPGWTESYEDIRNSLEKAFAEKKNNPSMRMTKKELIEIAESYGIEVPEKAVKKQILELIHHAMDSSEDGQDK